MDEWLSLCAIVLVLSGAAVYFLPVAECDRCAHCKAERLRRAEEHRLGSYCFQHRGVRRDCDQEHR